MILTKIKKNYYQNKKIFESVSYLTIIQIVAMLLPFLTYPYLIKTLGLGLYGKVMLSQAVVSYVAIFVNFGFNISAAKSVSEKLGDESQLNIICSAIITVKTVLWCIITFVYVSCILTLINEHYERILYLASYTLTFNEFLICQWFYQAKEQLKIVAISSIVGKIVNVVLVFVMIKGPDDYYLMSLITGACFFIIGLYCTFNMFKYHIKFVKPDMASIINVMRDSVNLFLTSAVIAIKNKLDVIFIGLFISSEMVAIYDFAQKILNILLLPISIINNAVFPRMNREKSSSLLKKILLVSLVFAISYTSVSELLIPYVMKYIFVISHDSVTITRIMIVATIFFALSLPLAQNGLIVFNYTKLHLIGMLSTTLIYIFIIAFGYQLGYLTNVYYFVFTSLILFCYEAIYRYVLCKWKKIL